MSTALNLGSDDMIAKLGTVCHVVEIKAPWVLIHATKEAVVRIIAEFGLSVHPAKRGGDYYAVKLKATAPLRIVPLAPKGAPIKAVPKGNADRLEIRGTNYAVKETNPKRRCDMRRWEVRKLGDELAAPYVVVYQSDDGCEAQCSCPDWVYRRRQCKHISAIHAYVQSKELGLNLQEVG